MFASVKMLVSVCSSQCMRVTLTHDNADRILIIAHREALRLSKGPASVVHHAGGHLPASYNTHTSSNPSSHWKACIIIREGDGRDAVCAMGQRPDRQLSQDQIAELENANSDTNAVKTFSADTINKFFSADSGNNMFFLPLTLC